MLTNYDDEVFINAFNDYYLDLFGEDFSYHITPFYWDYHSKTEEFVNLVEPIELQASRTSENDYFIYG